MTQIEKVARLMGCEKVDDMGFIRIHPDGSRGAWFDPLNNKGDLMDVEIGLLQHCDFLYINIDKVLDVECYAVFRRPDNEEDVHIGVTVYLMDHPDKFTARATAVINVAEQIYDKLIKGSKHE